MYADVGSSLCTTMSTSVSTCTSVSEQGSIYQGGGTFPPKSFTEKKKLQLFQIKILFDDDFKESVKVTNVQKCDFSQS